LKASGTPAVTANVVVAAGVCYCYLHIVVIDGCWSQGLVGNRSPELFIGSVALKTNNKLTSYNLGLPKANHVLIR